jgi:uncharacterized protein (TIGR02145 family)
MPMSKILLALLLLVFAAYGQQKRIAIVNTVDDEEPPVKLSDLTHLTDRLREIASNTLPSKNYAVMTQQSIVAFLGTQEEMAKTCKESEGCLANLGRKINADYIAQGRIGRFDADLAIKVELYESGSGNLVSSFTGVSKGIYGLLSILDEKAPDLFKKLPNVSSGAAGSPSFAGGIGGLQIAGGGYEFDGEKRYLASIATEPEGASLSFNGVPDSRCTKTPCSVELAEGSVRIIANLEQYEIADTTVSINRNNQSINIRLKANFGVLDIKPAYSEDIGKNEQWSLNINGKAFSSFENRLSPNKYKVELSHRCYEALSFDVGINKGKTEVFDMANHNIKLKMGGLVLSTERDGKPVSEPVYANGKHIGETPFSGSVPVCAKIEIGEDREKVDVELKYSQQTRHLHKMSGLSDIAGIWEGSYSANQGETGLTLNVYKEKGSYKAIFDFYSLPGKTNSQKGKYYMDVQYNQSTKEYYLKGSRWIEQPSGYGLIDLKGAIAGDVFSGSTYNFRVARVKKAVHSGTFTDSRDGKTYKTIEIGTQTWMAENLNYNADGSKCYDSKEANCQKYGRLYDWNTAKSACPKGWLLPINAEWDRLIAAVGGKDMAGKYLKATSWDGLDIYGFSALPGGYGNSNSYFDNDVGNSSNWLTASEQGKFYRSIDKDRDGFYLYSGNESGLFSVRCLQGYSTPDAEENEEEYEKSYEEPYEEPKRYKKSNEHYISMNLGTVDSRGYENKKFQRTRMNVIYEYGFSDTKFGGAFIIGGGKLGTDIGEFIMGLDFKYRFWPVEEWLAVPISFGIAWRFQTTEIENRIVADFIDEPAFFSEPEDYFDKKRKMSLYSFDIMPAIGMQFFIGKFSICADYAYNISFPVNGWNFTYKKPGNEKGDEFEVPKEYGPLQNQKQSIFGIPGAVRFGVKYHPD